MRGLGVLASLEDLALQSEVSLEILESFASSLRFVAELESAFLLVALFSKVDSSEKAFLSSLRAVLAAWQSTDSALAELTTLESTFVFLAVFSQVDSSASLFCAFLESACADMDCHALRSKARNDKKWACFIESAFLLVALFSKVDSRFCVFVCVDCHATAGAVSRNDGK